MVRVLLRRDLVRAIRARDSVAGLGAAEGERRSLTAAEVEEIVRLEVAERLEAAREYVRLGRGEQAGRLRAEAGVLGRYLTDSAS